MSANKYEPGRGMCVLHWQQGTPSGQNEYGDILLETWRVSLALGCSHAGTPEAVVHARLRAARWHYESKSWILDGVAYNEKAHGEIRRWARLSSRTARVAVTVVRWETP